jgi:anthranilate phosphoribosyltransferase
VAQSIKKLGIGFLFAPLFHPAMKRVAPIRKKLGIRTIFNLLGPLTNPAQPAYHLLGTTSVEIGEKLIEAMKGLNYTRAMVVAGKDGLDDITLAGKTTIFDLQKGKVLKFEFSPEEVGMKCVKKFDEISGGSPEKNAELFLALLQNKGPEALQSLLLLNTAFGFVVRGTVADPKAGVKLTKQILESGKAYEKFLAYKKFSHGNFS